MVVSRSHPDLVRKLFESEVPEIRSEIVKIKAIIREPGSRCKVAVSSDSPSVEEVGTFIGVNGNRVKSVINELRGEKIDIIRYSNDPAEYVMNALKPAEVESVTVDQDKKVCQVKVPKHQLSLAIGKGGQNVRLAARLTGWRIDIITNT